MSEVTVLPCRWCQYPTVHQYQYDRGWACLACDRTERDTTPNPSFGG